MAEYIEREAFKAEILRLSTHYLNEWDTLGVLAAADRIPAADVREVVTCEECVWHVDSGYHYCNKWCWPCPDNCEFFCAYGKRPNCGADMRGDNNG